jgi:ABC-type cobalamin/Fe3+-siderophores transport system ATPase subunit
VCWSRRTADTPWWFRVTRQFELTGVQVANLRGFKDATLPLLDGLTLLVGPNNSGKTSVLRLLDWALNHADEAVLLGNLPLSADELRLLMPARETRNAARRLILSIRVVDGRRRTRFQCDGDIAYLRIGLTMPGVLRLNIGPPRRNEVSDHGVALDLLRELRDEVVFSLVPASRDARSTSFRTTFRDAVLAKLEERATHAGRAGAPAEYRTVKRALEEIRSVADTLVLPLWEEVEAGLPPGMATSATVAAGITPAAIVSWLADRTELKITTGEHDRATVEPTEVGSGLQSLLELALQQARPSPADVERIVAVEEPEAFLHPAAQRTLARMISAPEDAKRLVSTHSPLLVEEARFGETVLVRDHRFFPPAAVDDAARQAINTALLGGYGAEMAFASSVLLVEGEGDRVFYETLRRRLARATADGRLDHLTVVPVGSKSAFAPWLRLLSSYGIEGDRPVQWLVVADGDAATEVRQAHRDAGARLPARVRNALMNAANLRGDPDESRFTAATDEVNRVALARRIRLHLSPLDMEHAALLACPDDHAAELGGTLGLTVSTRAELEVALRRREAAHLAIRVG